MKKRLLSVAIVAAMLCTLPGLPAGAKEFPDATGHWAQEAIETWSDRGVVNGDDAGNFRPGDPITRAETAKLMDNLIGFQKTSKKTFSDVEQDAWYASSVNKLFAAEVLTGYEDGTIHPTASITRQEAAVIIGRTFAIETKKVDTNILAQFGDNDQIQDWARPVVAFMASKGFIQGSDGMFRPADPITRAEIVTILNNMVGIYADGSQDNYTGDYGDKLAIVKAPTTFKGVTLGGAVVCGTAKGKVKFSNGSKVNGCLCNWSPSASVTTSGATVASTANKSGGSISSGATINAGGSGGSGGSGGLGGGGSIGGSGSSSTQRIVTYLANGGTWDRGSTQRVVTYTAGESYSLRLPINPTRQGYVFMGWYTDQISANRLSSEHKLNPTDMVTSTSYAALYAGWKKPSGLYGTVDVAVGNNIANRGKSAKELMDNVTVSETSVIDVYQAKGGLRYVTGYINSPTLNTEGNFLALTYTLPQNITTPSDVTVTSKFSDGSAEATYRGFTTGNRTYTRVFEVDAAALAKDIIFTMELAGNTQSTGKVTIDLDELIPYEFVTVATSEAFTEAIKNPAAEKITVDAPITLASGTYGTANTRKAVVANHPISLAKDSIIVLQALDITTADGVSALFLNTTEIPEIENEPALVDETDDTTDDTTDDETTGENGGENDGEDTPEATPVPTKVTGLMLNDITVKGSCSVLNQLLVKELAVKNAKFRYTGNETATAISLTAPAEGDKVSITDTTIDGYDIALEAADESLFDGTAFKNNAFLNNTTDIKLGVETAFPNLSYNYFGEALVLVGTQGAIDTYFGPLYADDTLSGTALTENLHDAFVYLDGVYTGTLSGISSLELTFETEEATHEITLVPSDKRDSFVTIDEATGATVTLSKADLPKELSITIGGGNAKTIPVSEAVVNE